MELRKHLELEREYHEGHDELRDTSSLIRAVYSSGIFEEAENYHLDSLGELQGAQVLDYGCGGGWGSRRLQARGACVVGFDISTARLREAQTRVESDASMEAVDFAMCAAEQLPFADCSFDAVFGQQILHHLELKLAIPEIVRVLRPGGRASFLEPLIHNPLLEGYRRLTPHLRSPTEKALSMKQLDQIGSHFSSYTHKEFCLLAVAPVLLEAVFSQRRLLKKMRYWLQRVDHKLVDALPVLGRYYWETVITVER